MSATITLQRDDYDFEARPPKRTTTNLSVDFIETSISLAEDSRYVAEKNEFVLTEDAESHENTMSVLGRTATTGSQLTKKQDLLSGKKR
jgi:hypothetical protein